MICLLLIMSQLHDLVKNILVSYNIAQAFGSYITSGDVLLSNKGDWNSFVIVT